MRSLEEENPRLLEFARTRGACGGQVLADCGLVVGHSVVVVPLQACAFWDPYSLQYCWRAVVLCRMFITAITVCRCTARS